VGAGRGFVRCRGPWLSDLRLCPPPEGGDEGSPALVIAPGGIPERDLRRPRCDGLSPPGTLGYARTEALCTLPLSLMMRPIS